MIIPSEPAERLEFYQDVLKKCLISREERLMFYRSLRSYFLFGGAEGDQAVFNKIQPTIQLLQSFIYSAETTKFNIKLGASVERSELGKISVMSEELNDLWHDSDTDLTIADAVSWSFVFGSAIIKTMWNDGIRNYLVEPDNFGVFREDIPFLSRQEAVVHCYSIAKSQLFRELDDHPHKNRIIDELESANKVTTESSYPSGMQNLLIAGTSPNASAQPSQGVLGYPNAQYDFIPQVDADLIEMYELYVWNDKEKDYQIVTMASPGIIIYDRKNWLIKGCLPFTKICPEPLPYYFWGQSFAAKLVPLQDWRTLRITQMKKLMDLQLKPPRMFTGGGIPEEKLMALYKPGGVLASSNPMNKVDTYKPDMPQDLFAEINQIDSMFDEMAGINSIMRGQGESGVRARGHADMLARLSSARPKQYALKVEDALESIVNLMLRLVQENSDKQYLIESSDSQTKNIVFIAKQFTTDFMVKVDGHSSSPIFAEDHKQDMVELFKAQAVDRETLLETFDPPDLQMLKEKLKIREAKEEQMKQMQMQAQQQQQKSGDEKGANDLKNRRAMNQAGA
jgi:hypothetical protein